jgi:ArsR family transcriptional regulator
MVQSKTAKVEEAAALLKALSHPVRLLILKTLMKEKCNVTNLEKISGLSQSGVSQHLRILRLSGIIEAQRDGKEICYKIINPMAVKIVEVLCAGSN